ncbi:MAG: Fe-S cluster assembly ATPase SufC [Bacilli bacterium]|nr:Fe-S cluster assembly ATPase SufC [Bacilli bacterium]
MSLLEIKNIHTVAEDDREKEILKGLDLVINKGEVHVIMGPNGSGKSTLANTIFNNPKYIVTDGDILFNGESIKGLKVNDIAKKGLFMSFQIPEEIPGVTVAQFLKTAKSNVTGEKINLLSFSNEVEENMEKLGIDKKYLNRELNVGFSGGEKKKNEILQLLTLNPELAILDETDSGLDVDAIKIVSKGIDLYKNDNNAVLIITHSTKILEYLKVDYVHVLVNGKIILSSDSSLAKTIEENGYSSYMEKNED